MPHMGFHDFNQQSLFIGIVVVDTRCLYTCDPRDITQRSCMVSVLCEQLHGGCENTFSHGAAFLLCHADILAEIWQHEHPLRQTTIRRSGGTSFTLLLSLNDRCTNGASHNYRSL